MKEEESQGKTVFFFPEEEANEVQVRGGPERAIPLAGEGEGCRK